MDATFGYLFRKLPIILIVKFLLYSVGITIAYNFFRDNLGSNTVDIGEILAEHPVWLVLLAGCVIMPLLEEIAFRFIPFGILRTIHDQTGFLDSKLGRITLWGVLLGTSFMFGFHHGGIGNIFLQGIGGLINGAVFIHWGVLNGHPGRGLVASTVVHGSWNFLIMGLFLLSAN